MDACAEKEAHETALILEAASTHEQNFVQILEHFTRTQSIYNHDQLHKEHRFWKTQPVPNVHDDNEATDHSGPIKNAPETLRHVRQDPYQLPWGFTWSILNMMDPLDCTDVYEFLALNYVEDTASTFRFAYSKDLLQWILTPPGFHQEWHIGVRSTCNQKLLAFVSGIPVQTRIYASTLKAAEINFLCVHKRLRDRRLAPVLIKELTRRVNLCNVWQAVYTAGVVLPMPVAQCRYFHRSLNPQKLIEVGFSPMPSQTTLAQTIKMLTLPAETLITGFRPMKRTDVPQVTKLLQEYLTKVHLAIEFSEREVAHWMVPRVGVVNAYVVENPDTHEVTDVCSFYHLPSTIIGNDKHKKLHAAYSLYNVAKSVTLTQLMQDALIMAKKEHLDVFNALDVMENIEMLQSLKFGPGSGELQYYLYNWRCPRMSSDRVGIVLC